MTQQLIQPQRQPLGTFRAPNGTDVPVYITTPWFRALQQLFQQVNSNTDKPSSKVTIDDSPAYQFGQIYYASGESSLRRLTRPTAIGQVLYGDPNGAPHWGDLPDSPSVDYHRVLFTRSGVLLTDRSGRVLEAQTEV